MDFNPNPFSNLKSINKDKSHSTSPEVKWKALCNLYVSCVPDSEALEFFCVYTYNKQIYAEVLVLRSCIVLYKALSKDSGLIMLQFTMCDTMQLMTRLFMISLKL